MIMDSLLEFSDAQAVTSTAISENVADLGPVTDNTLRDIGTGEDVYLVITTAVTCTDAGSDSTVDFSLESDSVVGLSSSTVHFSTGALARARYSEAGTVVLAMRLPAGDYERYLGVRYTVAGGNLSAGAFNAFLTKDAHIYKAYADRLVINPITG